MKLQVPFVQLPVQFDAGRLAAEMHALGDTAWRPHPQKFPGNFALPLISVNGDPESDSIAGPMRPTEYLDRCPYLKQVLAHLGAVWGRTRLMKLTGRAEVTPHADINYYWRERVRVHVPILTQPTVRFICGEAETNMAAGECWIFDTWRQHRVINAADEERVHLVADTVGSENFWELANRGNAPGVGSFVDWRVVAFDGNTGENTGPPLIFESVNVPKVMTPWELRDHINFILVHVEPHPQLAFVQQLVNQFIAGWQALWAQYGTKHAGWSRYREALDIFAEQMERNAVPLQLMNGMPFMNTLRSMVLRMALADRREEAVPNEPRAPSTSGTQMGEIGKDRLYERPIFLVSPPRCGSTLLFETLARAPGLYTIGHESHALIEGVSGLSAATHDFDSNRLLATDATEEIVQELRKRFHAELRDRDGHAPGYGAVRMLEKTPKNALRVPFLARVFPEAQFVYLYRDPRQTLASMIEAWESGRFCTYPQLPGWGGPPWSLLLTPGWRGLRGKPLNEIVAAQWEVTTRTLLDDLGALPSDRRCVAQYDALMTDPEEEITRLCVVLGLDWDMTLPRELPHSRHTVTAPDAEKWRHRADQIEVLLPGLAETIERAERVNKISP
ncbi:MAG: sulfotransferase [Rhodanobacteraceae bacterium]